MSDEEKSNKEGYRFIFMLVLILVAGIAVGELVSATVGGILIVAGFIIMNKVGS